jgi:hypothetical protein
VAQRLERYASNREVPGSTPREPFTGKIESNMNVIFFPNVSALFSCLPLTGSGAKQRGNLETNYCCTQVPF